MRESVRTCAQRFESCTRLGITTIMVTHDQEEALTMADRIVVMNEGKIEQVGTPQEIYSFLRRHLSPISLAHRIALSVRFVRRVP